MGTPKKTLGKLHAEVLKNADKRTSIIVYWIARNASLLLARFYLVVRVSGREHLRTDGATILAPVHRSNLDVPIISSYCGRRIRSMAKINMFKGKLGQWFSTAIGAFPVRRDSLDREALTAALEILRRRELLLVFPEGSRKSGRSVERILDGCSYLATKTGAPVIPIALAGTEEAMPPGRMFPRIRRIVVTVGEPLTPPRAAGGNAGNAGTDDNAGTDGNAGRDGRDGRDGKAGKARNAKEIRREFSHLLQQQLQSLLDNSHQALSRAQRRRSRRLNRQGGDEAGGQPLKENPQSAPEGETQQTQQLSEGLS